MARQPRRMDGRLVEYASHAVVADVVVSIVDCQKGPHFVML